MPKRHRLTLDDFYEQLQHFKKGGRVKRLMEQAPGGAGVFDDDEIRHSEAILRSMTPKERREPEVLNESRLRRVARGSARPLREVRALLKYFFDARNHLGDDPAGSPVRRT